MFVHYMLFVWLFVLCTLTPPACGLTLSSVKLCSVLLICHDPQSPIFSCNKIRVPSVCSHLSIIHACTMITSKEGNIQYRKFPKYSDTQKICSNHSKIWTMWLYHRVMCPKNADRMANSVDPDQTAPLGAVWSGSALFAQTYLSENLGSLWQFMNCTRS